MLLTCRHCCYLGDSSNHSDEERAEGNNGERQLPALDEGDDVGTEPGAAPLDEDGYLVPQTLADRLHVAAMPGRMNRRINKPHTT